jgi:hypothetical protein
MELCQGNLHKEDCLALASKIVLQESKRAAYKAALFDLRSAKVNTNSLQREGLSVDIQTDGNLRRKVFIVIFH